MAASVLVVEDEKLVALDICRGLSRRGYNVIGPVSSSEAALETALDSLPDIVLMDIHISGAFDGVTAAAQIRDRTNVPVVFLTAHADSHTLERAKVVEPAGYVLKPFDENALVATIEVAIYKNEQAELSDYPNNWRRIDKEPAVTSIPTLPPQKLPVPSDPVTFLRSVDFFSKLDEFDLSLLAQTCDVIDLRPGEALAVEGDDDTPCFLVCSGRVCVIKTTDYNRELIVAIIAPGELQGLTGAISNRPAPSTVRADKHSRLLLIPKVAFRLLLQSRPEVALRLTQCLADQLNNANNLARALAHDNVVTRVSSLLDSLVDQIGFSEPGVSVIEITRQELADLAGTTVETVVRVLKLLEKNKVLRSGRRKRIEIRDIEKLRSFFGQGKAEHRMVS